MKTPIILIIFNRPQETRKVIDSLRLIKPEKLYVIADGPRTPGELSLCEATRAVMETIDWECDIQKKYSEKNLGCGINVSSGITWAFEHEEQAIILEDDCLPNPTFFPFCNELLERYKNDETVMHISGNFFQQKNRAFKESASYYASILPHIWGWATWKRAWKKYDFNLTQWPEIKKTGSLKSWFKNPAAYEYWSGIWDQYYTQKINIWDAQWVFACAANRGICINPTVNLVSNIGYGTSATNTKTLDESANIPTKEISFPLIHPQTLIINRQADEFTARKNFGIDDTVLHRALRPIKNMFPNTYWKLRNLFRK